MYFKHLLCMVVLAIGVQVATAAPTGSAPNPKYPPAVQAVFNYLMNTEYPEVFDNKYYHIRPTGYATGDLDGNGVEEVVMSFYPQYLQSPTVVIFHVTKQLKVTRVTEGLAPGPIVPNTGEYLDSHVLGEAVDLKLTKKAMADPKRRREFVKISLRKHLNIVEYRNFFHIDHRKGKGTYLDMTRIANPPKDGNCSSFQFARVQHIEIDHKKGEKGAYLIAVAANKVYIYKIRRFLPGGFLDMTLKIVPLDATRPQGNSK